MNINRRQFFQLSAAAAVVGTLVVPQRTIFLPPVGGWFQSKLRMRECQQYVINLDAIITRYDAAWLLPDGTKQQFHVDVAENSLSVVNPDVREHRVEMARRMLEDLETHHGLKRYQLVELPLPRSALSAGYV